MLIFKAKLVSASKESLRKKEKGFILCSHLNLQLFFSALLSGLPGIIMLAKLRKNHVCNMSICVQRTGLAKKATTMQLHGCSELADESIDSLTRIHYSCWLANTISITYLLIYHYDGNYTGIITGIFMRALFFLFLVPHYTSYSINTLLTRMRLGLL